MAAPSPSIRIICTCTLLMPPRQTAAISLGNIRLEQVIGIEKDHYIPCRAREIFIAGDARAGVRLPDRNDLVAKIEMTSRESSVEPSSTTMTSTSDQSTWSALSIADRTYRP